MSTAWAAGARGAAGCERGGVDFVHRAVLRRQHEHHGTLGMPQDHGGGGVEVNLLADAEAAEIDDGHGAPVLVGDEAIARKARGFRFAAGGESQGGGEQQGSPGNGKAGHAHYSTVARTAHVILVRACERITTTSLKCGGGEELAVFKYRMAVQRFPA